MDAFQLAHDAISEGAVGVDMGRNIWQSDHPVAMITAIREIVHNNVSVREAKQIFEKTKTESQLLAKTSKVA
jgi:putative autoinducer-2 (AI-2) aldolase